MDDRVNDFEEAVDDLATEAAKERKAKIRRDVILIVVLMISSVGAFISWQNGESNKAVKQDLTTKVNVNALRIDEQAKILEDQRKQFELCQKVSKADPRCQRPVAPTVTVTPELPDDPDKTQGIGLEDVQRIVSAEVARRNFTVTPAQMAVIAQSAAKMIPKPKDGRTPTSQELQPLASAAVATFCANDACKGDDGDNGGEGPKGEKGNPPSQAELDATLAAYCSDKNGCIGKDGAAGRGIEAVTKVGETLTIKYTDGTSFEFTVKDGVDGKDGVDAFPFSFKFELENKTFSCTIQSRESTAVCE